MLEGNKLISLLFTSRWSRLANYVVNHQRGINLLSSIAPARRSNNENAFQLNSPSASLASVRPNISSIIPAIIATIIIVYVHEKIENEPAFPEDLDHPLFLFAVQRAFHEASAEHNNMESFMMKHF